MLDWRVGEAWGDEAPEPAGPRRWRPGRRWWLLPLAVLAVGLGVAGWLAWETPRHEERLRADVQATADLELWAWQSRDVALFETLIDPHIATGWRDEHIQEFRMFPQYARLARRGTPQVEVESVEAHGDEALVMLRVRVPDFPGQPLDYRQALPYRYVDGRWARSAPTQTLWGPTRRLLTRHFVFEYPERDAAAVHAVAAEIEGFYQKLRADLDLPASDGEVWAVRLTLDPPLSPQRDPAGSATRLPSPSLALLPLGMTPTRQLKLDVGRWLGETLARRDDWARPLSGAAVWNWPLAVAEWNTLAWADADAPDGASLRRVQRYQTLRQTFDSMLPTVTIVEYVATAYGRPSVAAMTRAARGGARSWEALLPASLGVGVDTFERAWLGYVEGQVAAQPRS